MKLKKLIENWTNHGVTVDTGYIELEAGKPFGRYRDVDGDGIPWRTLPGTHPSKGAFFTRGTSRNPQAMYSEAGADYILLDNMTVEQLRTAVMAIGGKCKSEASGGVRLRVDLASLLLVARRSDGHLGRE